MGALAPAILVQSITVSTLAPVNGTESITVSTRNSKVLNTLLSVISGRAIGVKKNLVAFRCKDEIKDYDIVMANNVYAQHILGDTFLCHQRFGIGRGAKAGKDIYPKYYKHLKEAAQHSHLGRY